MPKEEKEGKLLQFIRWFQVKKNSINNHRAIRISPKHEQPRGLNESTKTPDGLAAPSDTSEASLHSLIKSVRKNTSSAVGCVLVYTFQMR